MKCPFCNADMKDGQVFCEACGKEIHLVPLFDPEMEETIQASMSGIVEEFKEDSSHKPSVSENSETVITESDTEEPKSRKKSFFSYISLVIFGVVLAIVILLCVIGLAKPADFESNLQKAKDAYAIENYEKAISYGEQALEQEPEKKENLLDAYLILARSYESLEMTAEEDSILNQAIAAFPEEKAPYELLIAIYEADKDYEKLADILSDCKNQQILSDYAEYICNEPEFDTEGGTFEDIVYLRLIDDGKGKIYYTINGDVPDEQSDSYISPIKLENGNFEISAIFINEYGVKSDVVMSRYNILLATLDEPEISLDEGTYAEPQLIEVYMPDETYSVYYTVDGSEPNLSSVKYEGAFLLPFGQSHYKFVMYDEDGVASEVAERNYEFALENPSVVVDQARIMLLQNLIVQGYLQDPEGHVALAGTEEIRQYVCNTAFTENGESYYLFSENAVDALENSIRTGKYFAVSISTGEIYRVQAGSSGSYHVLAF